MIILTILIVCHNHFQAFIIAFTSEFLPKTLYRYSVDPTMDGYLNYTLSWAPQGTTEFPCRFDIKYCINLVLYISCSRYIYIIHLN